jgi:hypothetical protein
LVDGRKLARENELRYVHNVSGNSVIANNVVDSNVVVVDVDINDFVDVAYSAVGNNVVIYVVSDFVDFDHRLEPDSDSPRAGRPR